MQPTVVIVGHVPPPLPFPPRSYGALFFRHQVWTSWNQMAAVGLHKLQARIAYRGAQLLEIGGRLVYSTCSFNPIENEAIVANLLRQTRGALELVDVSKELPDLVRTPGLSTWTIAEKYGKVLPTHAEIDPQLKKQFVSALWPPTKEEAEWMHLERCVRVFPHQQNTGGVFITVFNKVADLPARDAHGSMPKLGRARLPSKVDYSPTAACYGAAARLIRDGAAPKPDAGGAKPMEVEAAAAAATATAGGIPAPDAPKKVVRGYKEDPFYFNEPAAEGSYWPPVKEFYGFDESFPGQNLITRTAAQQKKHIYFVSDLVRSILANNATEALRIINCGVKVLTRSDAKKKPCDFRLCMDGAF